MHDELAQLGMDGDDMDALFKRYRAGEGGVIISDRDGTEEAAALAAAEQAEAKGASYFAGKEVGLKWGAAARESDLVGLRRRG